jgi:hypothetical protein
LQKFSLSQKRPPQALVARKSVLHLVLQRDYEAVSSPDSDPQHEASNVHGGEEGICALGKSSGNSAPFFEIAEGISHQMPQFEEILVSDSRLFAVFSRRNLRRHMHGFDVVGINHQPFKIRFVDQQFQSP